MREPKPDAPLYKHIRYRYWLSQQIVRTFWYQERGYPRTLAAAIGYPVRSVSGTSGREAGRYLYADMPLYEVGALLTPNAKSEPVCVSDVDGGLIARYLGAQHGTPRTRRAVHIRVDGFKALL